MGAATSRRCPRAPVCSGTHEASAFRRPDRACQAPSRADKTQVARSRGTKARRADIQPDAARSRAYEKRANEREGANASEVLSQVRARATPKQPKSPKSKPQRTRRSEGEEESRLAAAHSGARPTTP